MPGEKLRGRQHSSENKEVILMDKDRVEGKMKDIKGRVERQVGEWTGDKDAQAEGTADQAKGKVQNAWGKVKDAGRDAMKKKDVNRGEERESEIDDDEQGVA
jgi:uncharacterized protein YjbJ (UPF0337 family)